MIKHTEQRKHLRAWLAGASCTSPASVFDPLSARVAESVGYEFAMVAGSVASNTTLGAPDMIILTTTEFAEQIRRIMRVSRLSLLVDADHGYGNALNVMRTVQEFEHAGVSALSIVDWSLPRRFGYSKAGDGAAAGEDAGKLRVGADELISIEEMTGKLRAALAARTDPELVIAGRTSLRSDSLERIVARVRAYAQTGIDAIYLGGVTDLHQLEIVREAADLPLVLGNVPATLRREELAARGVRLVFQGHQPLTVAVKALFGAYTHLFNGGAPTALGAISASRQEMERLVDAERYEQWVREFLH